MRPDAIELYFNDKIIAIIESQRTPDRGDLINVRKTNYKVVGRTFTVDHAEEPRLTQMVCILNLELAE